MSRMSALKKDRWLAAVLAGEVVVVLAQFIIPFFARYTGYATALLFMVAPVALLRLYLLHGWAARKRHFDAFYCLSALPFVVYAAFFIYGVWNVHGDYEFRQVYVFVNGVIPKIGFWFLVFAVATRLLGLGWCLLRGRAAPHPEPPRHSTALGLTVFVASVVLTLWFFVQSEGIVFYGMRFSL